MGFTTDKIKIKYILGTYKDSPEFPTGEDILYLMIKRAADRGEDLTDITFTTTKLYKKLGECNVNNVEKSLSNLVESGITSVVRETKDSQTYKILKNPYL
jgi:hypothetical protein